MLISLMLLLLTSAAIAQTSADSAAQRRMRDSIASLQQARDSLARLAGGLGGSADTSRSDTSETLIIFRGANASADVSRGVVAGGMVTLHLSRPMPLTVTPVISLTRSDGGPGVEGVTTRLMIQQYLDSGLVVRVPDSLATGIYEVNVSIPSATGGKSSSLLRPQLLKVESVGWILLISFFPILVLTLLVGFICVRFRTPQGQARYNAWKLLFLEPQNNTYSLSRAQFVAWTVAISTSYVFLFVARGLVESVWTFPPLAGFAMTFLISLGTLVAAQATTTIKGAKGSGDLRPSIADLVVHGGVLALERVQQVIWTIIAIGMFLWIVYKSYTTATELPVIPNELITLMGISSAGYIAGKAARKPGPIITNLIASEGSVYLTIEGRSLSKDATVWVDGTQLNEKATVVAADPANNEFALSLQEALSDPGTTLAGWYGAPHTVMVVNSDGQRAEWKSTPSIISATAGAPANGTVPVTVDAHYAGSDTIWELDGAKLAPGTSATRDPKTPNLWTLMVVPAAATAAKHQAFNAITLRDAGGNTSTYRWKPGAAMGGSDSGVSDEAADASTDTSADAGVPAA
jgi:hypothetical protein